MRDGGHDVAVPTLATGLDQSLKALEAYGKIPIRFLGIELDVSLSIVGELGIYAYDGYIL